MEQLPYTNKGGQFFIIDNIQERDSMTGSGNEIHIFLNDLDHRIDIFMKDVAGYFLSHFGLSPVCQ